MTVRCSPLSAGLRRETSRRPTRPRHRTWRSVSRPSARGDRPPARAHPRTILSIGHMREDGPPTSGQAWGAAWCGCLCSGPLVALALGLVATDRGPEPRRLRCGACTARPWLVSSRGKRVGRGQCPSPFLLSHCCAWPWQLQFVNTRFQSDFYISIRLRAVFRGCRLKSSAIIRQHLGIEHRMTFVL